MPQTMLPKCVRAQPKLRFRQATMIGMSRSATSLRLQDPQCRSLAQKKRKRPLKGAQRRSELASSLAICPANQSRQAITRCSPTNSLQDSGRPRSSILGSEVAVVASHGGIAWTGTSDPPLPQPGRTHSWGSGRPRGGLVACPVVTGNVVPLALCLPAATEKARASPADLDQVSGGPGGGRPILLRRSLSLP